MNRKNRKNRKLHLIRLRRVARAARVAQARFLALHDGTPAGAEWSAETFAAKSAAGRLAVEATDLFHATARACGTAAAVHAVNA